MGLRTVFLKLHKPSRGKVELLDEAMVNYNKAFQFLLKAAYLELDEICSKFKLDQRGYSSQALSKWISKDLSKELNKFHIQPFKDSLKLDFGMTMASYLKVKAVNPQASFPKFEEVMNDEGEDHPLRPIYFCRYDISRSYCLLHDEEKDKYFAKLYLANHAHARSVSVEEHKKGRLTYIHKHAGVLEREKKKEPFIVVPLSFGKYQEEFLKKALVQPEILRTAKLAKKGKDFFLAVSVDTGEVEKVKCKGFMGVARGLKNKLNCTIVDTEGSIISPNEKLYTGTAPGERIIPLDEIHKTANNIIDIALEHQCQVILQNLTGKSDRIHWVDSDETDYRPAYKCSYYRQLFKILEYKLPDKGLPPPIKVSSVDIFYTCPFCGVHSKQNRLARDMFICTSCGTTMDIERLGSLNLARKLINYGHSTIKVKVSKTIEGVWFINKMLGLKYYIPYSEDQYGKLKEEILRIVAEIKSNLTASNRKDMDRKKSIIKKIDSSEDFMNLIEFV